MQNVIDISLSVVDTPKVNVELTYASSAVNVSLAQPEVADVQITLGVGPQGPPGPSLPDDLEYIVGTTPGAPEADTNEWTSDLLQGKRIRLTLNKIPVGTLNWNDNPYFSKLQSISSLAVHGKNLRVLHFNL